MHRYIENKAQTSLICENPSYRKHIIDIALKGNKDPLFETFTHKFYSYLPVDYMEPNKIDFFAKIVHESFSFCKSKDKKNKIKFVTDWNGTDYTIMQIITADKPFIVDSVKGLLHKHGVHVKHFLHPLMGITRSSDGEITDIGGKGEDESIIFALLQGVVEEVEQNLLNDLANILDKIELILSSRGTILEQIQSIKTVDQEFLTWLASDNFTFLGSMQYDVKGSVGRIIGDNSVYKQDKQYMEDIVQNALASGIQEVFLGKMNQISEISTNKFIDYILVPGKDGGIVFFGFYGSSLYSQSIKTIPVLSNKLEYVLERSSFKDGGYNYRKLQNIVESFPREALFQIDQEDLYCICLHILSAMLARTLKLFIQPDSSGEFLNVLVFMPIERLTPEVHLAINKYLISKFNTKIITDEITDVSSHFCYLYVTLETNGTIPGFSLTDIEHELDHLSARWHLSLIKGLKSVSSDVGSISENTFPKEYQYLFSPADAAVDWVALHDLDKKHHISFNLQKKPHHDFALKIYSTDKIILSDILPLIENLGFKALSEQMFSVNFGGKAKWVCEFALSAACGSNCSYDVMKSNIEDALYYMTSGKLESDILCKLIVLAALNWRQVSVLKAITAYINQIGFTYSRDYVQSVLVKHHEFSALMIGLFEAKFDPQFHASSKVGEIESNLADVLNNVTNNVEDKVLRTVWATFNAIMRTNCYQMVNGNHKAYISFKFDSHKVPDLPLPVPYAEIFVYGHDFEGVHLRGGKVARGGIRWSDRIADYRTEALGLMKAQMTKNTVIVPVGSKGAFYVKVNADVMNRKEYLDKGVECYKNFLRGLLDLTDNVVDGKIVHPISVIMYDDEDPYLVVAADKGTASFSDYANSISAEYHFWMGDAFASGGSAGYDHKKMAITSKGAWISVTRHFAEMGIDVQKDCFTAVGIGDMSGDVFGNGMLRSSSFKLVAAFNHKHIFIDPTPDQMVSFQERQRLFELPGSGWNDYNINLISPGGGVFERSSKRIEVSLEARALLDIESDSITPDELINKILRARVDLLWNGGIGTYIKATSESHLEVGDKSNDNLRCNGNQVRAKVVGEGGNLGCSQLGRIEYAKAGGKINTDFIDNSAGVDCSDHEVNIKIALQQAIKKGSISLDERNKLLADMTDNIAELVLVDNYKQTQALSLLEHSVAYNIGMFAKLIELLESDGLLNRGVEFLPEDAELSRRALANENLTRPELAVILSYSKMHVYTELLTTKIADDYHAEEIVMSYFPEIMKQRFINEIKSHQLRKEIVLTIITNKIVNQLGGPIIAHIQSETGAKLCDIVRAFMIVTEIFGIDDLWKETEGLSGKVKSEVQIDIFSELIKLMRRGISWFVRNLQQPIDIANAITTYGKSVQDVYNTISPFLLGQAKQKQESKIAGYESSNVPSALASKIAILDSGISALDVVTISLSTGHDATQITELYFKVADRFELDWLRKCAEKQITDSYWNRMSVQALKDDLYDKQRRLLHKVLECNTGAKTVIDLDAWMESNSKIVKVFGGFIEQLHVQETVDLNMVILANKQFEMLLRKV